MTKRHLYIEGNDLKAEELPASPSETSWYLVGSDVSIGVAYDTYTKLLIHSDGGESIIDDTGNHVITTVGDVVHSSVEKVIDSTSVYFPGTDDRLSIPHSSDFDFLTGNYTIEFFINMSIISSYSSIYDYGLVSPGALLIQADNIGNRDINVYVAGALVLTSPNLDYDEWNHFALVKEDGFLTMFIAGVGLTPVANNVSISNTAELSIGCRSDGTSWELIGYLDEIRISKGIARYTEDFVPPTEAFTGTSNIRSGDGYLFDTDTSALTLTLPLTPTEGYIIYVGDYTGNASTNNITIDRNGNNINGAANNYIITTDREVIKLLFSDTANGWIIVGKN